MILYTLLCVGALLHVYVLLQCKFGNCVIVTKFIAMITPPKVFTVWYVIKLKNLLCNNIPYDTKILMVESYVELGLGNFDK